MPQRGRERVAVRRDGETATGSRPRDAKPLCSGWGCWDMGLGNNGMMNCAVKEENTLLLADISTRLSIMICFTE